MTITVYAIIYLAALVFFVACVVRAVAYAKAPVHLRWELYPVPHEEADRVKHGGSYFEAVDWWTKPSHFNIWGELKFMVPEMLFLKGLWEFNRKMWFRSFPFHFGLYLLIGTIGLLVVGALAAIFAPGLIAGTPGTALHYLYTTTGLLGSALVLLGALGLLMRRLTDEELKTYSTPGDIFNLLFFVVALGFLIACYLFGRSEFPGALAFTQGLLTFDTSLRIPGLLAVGLVLGATLAAYIPLTHMSHFIAKYFTYHSVRWDDQATVKGGKLESKIAEYLTYRPTWAAPHVGADGTKTWAEVATTNPAQGGRK
jgi:nitrate reductase gamma subunit